MSDRQLALLGFCLHAPGLWIFGKVRLGPTLARENRIALLWTAVPTIIAGVVSQSVWIAVITWTIGHFIWSGLLARAALMGRLQR